MAEAEDKPVATGHDAKTGRFVKGNRLSKGRKGSRNKLGEKFLADLLAVYRKEGKRAIEKAAAGDPVAFIKTIANLLPKEIAQSINVDIHSDARLKIELATFDEAYECWGKYLGAQPIKVIESQQKLLEAQQNGVSDGGVDD